MDAPTADELKGARRPLDSLLTKSEKAQRKPAPGTWPHTMLGENVKASRVALALMDKAPSGTGCFMRGDLQEALRALASMAAQAGQAQSKFAPGTSQHTPQRNRLGALRVAETLVSAELSCRDADPAAAAEVRNA